MAFTETERVQIRRYMGATALYQNQDTRLESAITTVSNNAAQESEVRDVLLVKLISIDAQLENTWPQATAAAARDVKVDAARGMVMLRSEGRRFAKRLAAILGFEAPRSDAFAPATSNPRPVSSGSGLP